jgi:hypothetical protein
MPTNLNNYIFKMKICGYIHIDVMVLETLGEKHEVVVRAPDYIPLLVVLVDNISEHLVSTLVRVEL